MALYDPVTPEALSEPLELLLMRAKEYGAESADAIATHGRSLSVTTRAGELEDVDNSEGRDIGLRVMIGQRQASVSSSDISAASIDRLAERVVAMARLAPEDPYCGLAPEDRLCEDAQDLDLYDGTEMTPQALKIRALEIEAAAGSVAGVKQVEGANANCASSAIFYMTSHGFAKGWRSSRHGLSVTALASQNDHMERDYDYHASRWFADLKSPETVGVKAGQRAVAKLGANQLASSAMPVLFDKRVSRSLLSAFLGAINGAAITRGISFLKDKMGEDIFPSGLNIIDDPLIMRGHGSRPWDGEGVAVSQQVLVEDGQLKSWLLNCSAARQLELQTNGRASRGIGSPPGISSTNCFIPTGEKSQADLLREMGNGLMITEMFGPSLNSNTGDYSVGVTGVKIENGEKTHPVNEVTIAGNLLDVFRSLQCADDLEFDGSTVAPSLLTEGLTVAGS